MESYTRNITGRSGEIRFTARIRSFAYGFKTGVGKGKDEKSARHKL